MGEKLRLLKLLEFSHSLGQQETLRIDSLAYISLINRMLAKFVQQPPISDVINGKHPGRSSADEITVFDGTGVGLQDLAAATASARAAVAQGQAILVEL